MEHFKKLNGLDVNEHVEKKNGLSYLSWAWAWDTVKKEYPGASYKIIKDENGKAYFGDEKAGYMVYTEVTIEGMTHEMWLPVMDLRNKSILQPTTFDINKAIMRCLTKNLAMFGVGLYIYAGEDLPEAEEHKKEEQKKTETNELITESQQKRLYAISNGKTEECKKILEKYNYKSSKEIKKTDYEKICKEIENIKGE